MDGIECKYLGFTISMCHIADKQTNKQTNKGLFSAHLNKITH
jgi:hypothetical protein